MKSLWIRLTCLLFSAVLSANAAPVLYSFGFNAPGPRPHTLNFLYLAPAYVNGDSGQLNTNKLLSSSVLAPDSLFSVELSQSNLATYSFVDIVAVVLEGNDLNQAISIDFHLSNGPGNSISFTDDASYTYDFHSLPYWSAGTGVLSVTSTPEPSSALLLLSAVPLIW